MPTTRILRHNDDRLPAEVKARYHQHLGTKLGMPLPTPAEERTDPAAADARYTSAIHWLLAQCRGPAHVLVLNENTSYGFRRNLFGLKIVGLALCTVCLAVPVLAVWSEQPDAVGTLSGLRQGASTLTAVQVGAAALCIISAVGWLTVVRGNWVKEAGELYALRLLATCDTQS